MRARALRLIGLLSLLATSAEAAPWVLEGKDSLNERQWQLLVGKHGSIDSPDDLDELLRDITKLAPFLSLESFYDGQRYIVVGTPAKPIGEIEIRLTTRAFKAELESRLHKYVAQVDSPEIRGKMINDIRRYLNSRGFYRAEIKLKTEPSEQWISYKFRVEEDYPCLVREVATGFPLPSGATLDVRVGDVCDQEAIQKAALDLETNLKELGYNQHKILTPEVDFDPGSNSARVFLPGTLGQKVTYRIISPVERFWSDDLTSLDPGIVDPDSMQTEITRKFENDGFDDVKVSAPERQMRGPDEVQYVFRVDPGPQYRITNVEIEGLSVFTIEEALDAMELDSFLRLDSPPLNQEFIRKGIDSLKAKYNSSGYWDAEVHFPRITKDPRSGQAKLVYVVREGRRRVLEKVTISGNKAVPTEEIRNLLATADGSPLIWPDLVSFEQKLRAAYHKQGYIYATFKIDLVQSRGFRDIPTRVVVAVNEGPRVRFGEITVTGLVSTQAKVVKRELRFAEGDWYDPDKVEDTRRALINLGLFSSVNIVPGDSAGLAESSSVVPYTVSLRESRPGTVSFGPGWSLNNGFRYGVEASYNNIAGTGRQIYFKGAISEEHHQDTIGKKMLLGRTLGVGYVEPYVFDWPVDGSISASHKAEAADERWDLSRAAEVSLTHELRELWAGTRLTGFYGQKITQEEAEEAQKDNLIATGNVRIGRLGLRLLRDRRNNLSWPTAGYLLAGEMSWARFAFGGDLQYTQWEITNNYYTEVYQDWVIAAGFSFSAFEHVARKGVIHDALPASERLYAGGADTNRGFRPRSLGPVIRYYEKKSNTYKIIPAGGTRRAVFKTELRYQIIKDTMAITSFVDMSNVFFTDEEVRKFRRGFAANPAADGNPSQIEDNVPYTFDSLLTRPSQIWRRNYVSYGLALNYLTPLGSFNLSYGIPWRRCVVEQGTCFEERGNRGQNRLTSGVFHINVGANF